MRAAHTWHLAPGTCWVTPGAAPRAVAAAHLVRGREVEVGRGLTVHSGATAVHRSSSIDNYYQVLVVVLVVVATMTSLQVGSRDTRSTALVELVVQVLRQRCFAQLRTKEQLGYVVQTLVRRVGGQGVGVVVQSHLHPDHLDTRVEAFLAAMEEELATMEQGELEQHIEALATKRLEKPRRVGEVQEEYWREIRGGTYHFSRAEVEVAEVRRVTREELVAFYRRTMLGEARRKLSCRVLSVCEGGAGCQGPPTPPSTSPSSPPSTSPSTLHITDITEYKSRRPLLPIPTPYTPLQELVRTLM